MIGYAVKQDGSWRSIDSETMSLADDETFHVVQPPETDVGDWYESKRNQPAN